MLPGSPRPPWGQRIRAVLGDGAPAGQLVACIRIQRGHGDRLPASGDLELGEAGPAGGQVLRAAYAPGVAGEMPLDARGLRGGHLGVCIGGRGGKHGAGP